MFFSFVWFLSLLVASCFLIWFVEQVGAIQAQRAVQVQVVGGACTLPGAPWNWCLGILQ